MERDHRDNGLAQGILHHYSLEQQRPAIIQTEANKRHQNNDSMELKQKKMHHLYPKPGNNHNSNNEKNDQKKYKTEMMRDEIELSIWLGIP